MKQKKYYFGVILYGLLLIFALLGIDNVYGNNIDWIMQHTIIPDYFRNQFYETGQLIPNLAFHLGGGQNIFNLSYYGLMSPVILISYLLPFVEMKLYIIIASVVLYLLSGILLFRFFAGHHYSGRLAFLISIVFLSLAPMTYHFHYHIMFVWYIPFLILGLMGVDRYVENHKSWLLMISIFLIILTNYYYAVPALFVIVIYGVYRLLENYDTVRGFLADILKAMLRIIIPVLMASFILLPTLYSISNSGRASSDTVSLKSLFFFEISNGMYNSFSAGITFIFLTALIGNIISSKKTKQDLFLNIALLIITLLPVFSYVLNGFLYVRGKVLIPFAVLYALSLIAFMKRLIAKEINLKKLLFWNIILAALILAVNYISHGNVWLLLFFMIDVVITTVFLALTSKNKYFAAVPLCLVLLSSFGNNFNANYMSKELYHELNEKDEAVTSLLDSIEDETAYRIDTNHNTNKNMNKTYGGYYTTSIYSSTFNPYYSDFYHGTGNNIIHRNRLMTSGSDNPLFYNFMGVKYIISEEDNLDYEVLNQKDGYYLYRNQSAYPLVYLSDRLGSAEQYRELPFPYNLEYMMNYSLVENGESKDIDSNLEKIDLGLEESYELNLKERKKITHQLDDSLNLENKYLVISFKMNYAESCKNGDTSITINGVKNKLSCRSWIYRNQNDTFEYLLPATEKLNITISPGRYEISDINACLLEKQENPYQNVENLEINEKTSVVTGEVLAEKDSYLITSFPYDKGFSVYVDGKPVKGEVVNTAFLGFPVDKGKHDIKIVYQSPLYREGVLLSFIALSAFIVITLWERRKRLKLTH